MTTEQNLLLKYSSLKRFNENFTYNQKLHEITLFPYNNIHNKGNIFRLILNFSFREIDFNKKKALPFFLAMELLTNQKCVATLSSKNILAWKLRKGALVGCKVTLRKKNLFEFIDNLNLSLPRMEKFKPITQSELNSKKNNSFTLRLTELVLFYPIELGLGINTEVKKIEANFLFNTLTEEEKLFILTSNKIPVTSK